MSRNGLAEKYCVRSKSGLYYVLWLGEVLFIGMLFACVWLLFFDAETAESGEAWFYQWFGIPLSVCFTFLCTKGLYDELRPRVVVEGGTLLYYPKWKKPRRYRIDQITGRKTWLINDDALRAIGPMFGVIGAVATKDMDTSRFEITYLIGGEPAIKIHTGMQNARRLDETVKAHLKMIGTVS